jgi:hypothetical protein
VWTGYCPFDPDDLAKTLRGMGFPPMNLKEEVNSNQFRLRLSSPVLIKRYLRSFGVKVDSDGGVGEETALQDHELKNILSASRYSNVPDGRWCMCRTTGGTKEVGCATRMILSSARC